MLSCIDLTSLESTDTQVAINKLCEKAKLNSVASVCVYPVFSSIVKENLKHTGVKTAVVAGYFPSGQAVFDVKKEELKYALGSGADEIDWVFSRNLALEEKWDALYNEIYTVKSICGNIKLKVILETGELNNPEIIYKAAFTVLSAGADFVKTSTGKCRVGATLHAAEAMINAIESCYRETNVLKGLKISGGIKSFEHAAEYFYKYVSVFNINSNFKDHFRIGTSKLI